MPKNARLSAKQYAVIAALVAGKTASEAATTCKVNEATVYRWKQEQAFRDELHAANQEVLKQALTKLIRYTAAAIDTLARNMTNDTGAAASVRSVQVRAAQAILDASIAVHRAADVDRRLEALEERESIA